MLITDTDTVDGLELHVVAMSLFSVHYLLNCSSSPVVVIPDCYPQEGASCKVAEWAGGQWLVGSDACSYVEEHTSGEAEKEGVGV